MAYLAQLSGPAPITPKEIADASGAQPIRPFIGTGPYRFVEWAPDRYVHLSRLDRYASRPEPASGYAGRKEALADNIFYLPEPQVATRIAACSAGTTTSPTRSTRTRTAC